MTDAIDPWNIQQAPNLTSDDWMQAGEDMAFELFHKMAREVPAYGTFLRHHGVEASSIKSTTDLGRIPVMTKDNYLTKYPLKELLWGGTLDPAYSISVSSGSTGQPFFWPLGAPTLKAGEFYYELLLRYVHRAHERRTLVVNCYAMGTWIAGIFTTTALNNLSLRQDDPLKLVVTSPGLNVEEALRIATEMGPLFDQVLLIGYGPFLKDIIAIGRQRGIDWNALKVKLNFAGEPFNEMWRHYMLDLVGAADSLSSANSAYAACDTGLLGVELPAAVWLRGQFHAMPERAHRVYGRDEEAAAGRIPTLQQYNPAVRRFESDGEGGLLVSGDAAIPLLRYNMLDRGGIVAYDAMAVHCPELAEETRRAGETVIRMPFVYVYGRAHNAVTLYAVTIWPENIRAGIESPQVRTLLSGKHRMAALLTADNDPYLEVTLELAPHVDQDALTIDEREMIHAAITDAICHENTEYRELRRTMGPRVEPTIIYRAFGDVAFKPGAKLARAEVATT